MKIQKKRVGHYPEVKDICGGSKTTELRIERDRWIHKYALRILHQFQQWQTPLGVTNRYLAQIKKDLTQYYDDPLKRLFVEASY